VGIATQDDAARAAGVSRISWARYETGATSPGRKTIRGIANALRVDETEVLARVGLSVLPKGNFVQIAKVADVIGNGPVTEATAQQLLREIRNLTYRLDEQNSTK
jgi:transcriptional regulator with XRE-family HTH domain